MNKKESTDLTNDMLVADILLRLRTLENILIKKGVFTKDEFQEEMEHLAKQIAKSILQNAGVPGEIDDILKSLKFDSKKEPNN